MGWDKYSDKELDKAIKRAADAGDLAAVTELEREMSSRRTVFDSLADGLIDFSGNVIRTGINQASALVGGGPDLVNEGLRKVGVPMPGKFGDVQNFVNKQYTTAAEGLMGDIPEGEPDSIAGQAGRITGETLPFLFGLGAVGKTPQGVKAFQEMTKAPGKVTQAVRQMHQMMVNRPVAALGTEAAAVGGAALGADVAKQRGMGPTGQMYSEIGGGMVGTLGSYIAPASATARSAKWLFSKVMHPFTDTGTMARASAPMQEVVATTPATALQEIEFWRSRGSKIPTAFATGDEGLMAYARAALQEDDMLLRADELSRQSAEETAKLADKIRGLGNIQNTKDFIKARRDMIFTALEKRTQKAADKAKVALKEAGADITPEEQAAIIKQHLESAYADSRMQESIMWQAVPMDAEVPVSKTLSRYKELKNSVGIVGEKDLPERMPGFFRRVAALKKGRKPIELRELDALYKYLGQVERNAAGAAPGQGQNLNMARIAGELQQAVLDDMSNVKGGQSVKDTIDTARAFSRQLNRTFKQGPAGKLLGYDKTGGVKTPDSMLMETAGNLRGEKGRVTLESFRKTNVGMGPKGVEVSDNPNVLEGIQTWLKSRFMEVAAPEGRIDPAASQAFIRQHRQVLEAFPHLRAQFETAKDIEDVARRVAKSSDAYRSRLDVPSVSAAAKLLKADPHREIDQILGPQGNKSGAAETMKMIYRMARKNPEAREGIKEALGDWLVRTSSGKEDVATGYASLNGAAMKLRLKDPTVREIFEGAFGKEKMKELETNIEEIIRWNRVNMGPARGVPVDKVGRMVNFIAEYIGAQAGGKLANTSGSGIKMAAAGSREMKGLLKGLTHNKALQMSKDMLFDDQLLKAGLTYQVSPPFANRRTVKQAWAERTLRRWLLSRGNRLLEEEDKEDSQEAE